MADRNHKKRRAVARASLTKLGTKLTELEANRDNPDNLRVAQSLATKLKGLDGEFRIHHLAIVDSLMTMKYWLRSNKL